jgi:hypothetical protein
MRSKIPEACNPRRRAIRSAPQRFAGRESSTNWNDSPVRVMSPFNLFRNFSLGTTTNDEVVELQTLIRQLQSAVPAADARLLLQKCRKLAAGAALPMSWKPAAN